MPLIVEHLRKNVKSHPDNPQWKQVDHWWTMDLTHAMSHLIEEDGGPKMAHTSGYGDNWGKSVDHTFTMDYMLPDGEGPIRKGDRIRMWREV